MAPKKIAAAAGLETKDELKAILLADSYGQVRKLNSTFERILKPKSRH
jgi:hypothetical protein